MTHRLHIMYGSHPCVAVEHALQVKGQRYTTREVLPPFQVVVMRLRFGRATVPGIRFAGGEKVQGSMAIMHRLDELYPEPALYHPDPDLRARAAEAERWGDDDLQMIGRRVLFGGFRKAPGAMSSYLQGARIRFPAWVTRLVAPLVIAGEWRIHRMTHEQVARDLEEMDSTFGRIDEWIAEGVLGGDLVTATDLQIAASLRLLLTSVDIRERFGDRPSAQLALGLIPDYPGELPLGTFSWG